jgi:hypothetical protein
MTQKLQVVPSFGCPFDDHAALRIATRLARLRLVGRGAEADALEHEAVQRLRLAPADHPSAPRSVPESRHRAVRVGGPKPVWVPCRPSEHPGAPYVDDGGVRMSNGPAIDRNAKARFVSMRELLAKSKGKGVSKNG